ncbi:MAG: efflux RND transporter permease subunit, partial [Rikenellaceae bacterium]
MKIYETSVKKPISTILIFIGVIVFGLFSLKGLSIDLYPEMDIPAITVMTSYPGANAADIETNISRILEDNLNTVDNLDKITSKSSDNISLIQLEFEWGSDLDAAANDVRDVIGRVQSLLPEEAETPTIFKFSSSMIPVVILYATAEESYPALNKILDDKLVNTLNRIDGVGAVSLMGVSEREVQINVDPRKMEAYNLSVEQLGQIIKMENIDTPSGNIDIGQQTLSIRSKGEFASSDEVKNIVVATRDGKEIYLSEIAVVKDTTKQVTLDERINGKTGVRIIIQKQSGANSVAIAKAVQDMLPQIQNTLPPDIELGVVVDMSESISESISSLSETIMWAFLFVVLVVLFFLGRWRATFIIILTIPVSLIVAFIYLKIVGSTLNIISLSSLSIAIGMVVDDAIVVLENITKHIERGSTPKEAAIHATNEVWLAVIATTLVVVAVFLPLTMLTGMAGIMFRELGMIVSLVTVVSTIAAISLTPMLSSLLLTFQQTHTYKGLGLVFKPIDKFLDRLDNGYAKILKWSIRRRSLVLGISVLIFASSIGFLKAVPTEFFPKTDDGRINATVKLEQGVSVNYSMVIARQIDSLIAVKYPEVSVVSTSTGLADADNIYAAMQGTGGSHVIELILKLPKKTLRERTIFTIGDSLRSDLAKIAEITQSTVTAGGGGMTGESDISVKVFGYDMDLADATAKELRERFKTIKGATDVELSRDDMRPEYRIKFDRSRLGYYGLTTASASAAVRNRINGLLASKYREDGDEYDIYVRYDEQFRRSIDDVENIIIYNPQGKPIRIKDVGKVIEEFAPPTIEREDRERVVSINMSLSGAAMSDVIASIEKEMAEVTIPEGLYIQIGGTYEDQQESFADMFTLLILIIILVYIVMATQFESFRMPFIILFSLPFAFTGVFLALYLTNTPLSIIALIGAIMLVGIVVKNGIVMVDFINLLRERGESL